MKKLAITGSTGTVGKVLKNGLSEYKIVGIDLPEVDVSNYEKLLASLPADADALIHLAWDTANENWGKEEFSEKNSRMSFNVLKAAEEKGIKRVIMASSVHADEYRGWEKNELLDPYKTPVPDSPYGANKVFMEALGRHFSKQYGLEVICLRLGGIKPGNMIQPDDDAFEKAVWLKNDDCISLLKLAIEAKEIPDNFIIVNAVSDNPGRIHDISNLLGWTPK